MSAVALREAVTAGHALARQGAAAPVSRSRIAHVPALDGLRGLAALWVMAYHGSSWASGGFLGVDIFFALSGFLITALLVRERVETGAISLRRFYLRRALRLLPALGCLLAVYLALAALLDRERLLRHVVDAGSTVLYAANLPRAFGIGRPVYLGPCWSLSVEEHFYLVWAPLLLWLTARVRDPRRLATVIAGMALLAWGARVALLSAGTPTSRLYYMLDTRADALLLGCALGTLHGAGVLSATLSAARRRMLEAGALLIAGAWLWLLPSARFDEHANHLWRFTFVAASTTALIAVAVCAPGSLASRALSWAPLRATGRLSYGLYLWHYPIFLFMARHLEVPLPWILVLGGPLALAAAAASCRFVEAPALRIKARLV